MFVKFINEYFGDKKIFYSMCSRRLKKRSKLLFYVCLAWIANLLHYYAIVKKLWDNDWTYLYGGLVNIAFILLSLTIVFYTLWFLQGLLLLLIDIVKHVRARR